MRVDERLFFAVKPGGLFLKALEAVSGELKSDKFGLYKSKRSEGKQIYTLTAEF
jgi:hypothetical protein